MKSWLTRLGGAEVKVWKLQDAPIAESKVLDNPGAVVEYLRAMVGESVPYRTDVESFVVVYLSTRLRAICWQVVSTGTLDTLLIHPREVFKGAIVVGAAAIILAHNHPSGDPTPSEADIKVTRDLIRAGQLLKIDVKDHVVLGVAKPQGDGRGWVSMREMGFFYS